MREIVLDDDFPRGECNSALRIGETGQLSLLNAPVARHDMISHATGDHLAATLNEPRSAPRHFVNRQSSREARVGSQDRTVTGHSIEKPATHCKRVAESTSSGWLSALQTVARNPEAANSSIHLEAERRLREIVR